MDRQIQKIMAGEFDNDSVFDQAERDHRGSMAGGQSVPFANTHNSAMDIRLTDIDAASSNLRASNITSFLDIDIEEVDDRLEEL